MSWVNVELDNYVDLISGPAFKSALFTESEEDIPLVKGDNISQGYIDWKKSKYWPNNDVEKYSQYWLEEGDVILAMDRPWVTAGLKYSWIKPNDPKALLVQRVARMRGKNGLSTDYLRYVVSSKNFSDYIKNIMGGTNVPHISGKQIKSYEILLPPEPIQAEIVRHLTKYDDLIENNKRRIELLEESARQLYKEWFVRFRFPGHEHVKIIDGVPEGWESKKVGELLMKVKRPGKVKKDDYLEVGDFPCVDQSQGFIGGYTDKSEVIVKEPLPLVVFGDHTRVLKFVDFPFACGADGTQLLHPGDRRLSIEYFYFALIAIDLSNYFYARHFKFLKDQIVLIPSDQLMQAFTEFASTNMKQISKLRNQNKELALARDLLLPKLMNGEIVV